MSTLAALCWSRHAHAQRAPMCAVVERTGRSVVTACRGRWEVHPLDLIAWDAPADLQCGGCRRALAVDAVPDPIEDEDTADKRVVDVGLEETALAERDPLLDPAWEGEGPRLARERLERRR